MKKILVALFMVLALSSAAMASTLTTSGYVVYNTGDFSSEDGAMTAPSTEFRINFNWVVNDQVSAYIRQQDSAWTKYAITWAPKGVPGKFIFGSKTIIAGVAEVGVLGENWGGLGTHAVSNGVAFQSNSFNGLSGLIVSNPNAGDVPTTRGRVAYAADFGTVGFNFSKKGEADADYSVDASIPVPAVESLKVYGEVGKKADDTEVQLVGATINVAKIDLFGEYDLANDTVAFEACKDLGGVLAYFNYNMSTLDEGEVGYFPSYFSAKLEVDF